MKKSRIRTEELANEDADLEAAPALPPPQKRHHPLFWLFFLILLIALAVWLWYHFTHLPKNKKLPPVLVTSAVAERRNVPVYLPALGSVTPTYTVTVRTQINGQLWHVYFREGQMVDAGELIAQIDPRPYLAQLIQLEGQLKHDRAQLINAEVDLKRYERLYPIGAVSKQTYDTQKWTVQQFEGTVKSDEGQIEGIKLNLMYCSITSPVNGRIGLRLVDPGNYVQTSDTNGLVVIDTIQPITVVFTLPEDNIPAVMDKINAGKNLLVQAYDRTQNQLIATGTLLTIDNQIDTTTGTVKLKANFSNNDLKLFPNQFVNIQLLIDTLHNATLLPTAAIQQGPQQNFVYVINNNDTVSVRTVTTGVTSGNNTVITNGVMPGESVVLEGADKLIDGAKIKLTQTPAANKSLQSSPQLLQSALLDLPEPNLLSDKEKVLPYPKKHFKI